MEQPRPFFDLLRVVAKDSGMLVVDLGCGSGEFTRVLADVLYDSYVLGIDSSPEMIQKAQVYAREGLSFQVSSIEEFLARDTYIKYDLIFSLATLQLVDNHATILTDLSRRLNSHGQLVVQLVEKDGYLDSDFEEKLTSEISFTSPVLSREAYTNILFLNGATRANVFGKAYCYDVSDTDVFYENMKTNILSTYLQKLPQEQHEAFKEGCKAMLLRKYPEQPDEPTLFWQKRLFLLATF